MVHGELSYSHLATALTSFSVVKVDKQCHGEGSMYNKCLPYENIYDPAKCGSAPAPAPAPGPTDGGFSKTVLKELFKLLNITDVDVDSCELCQLSGPGGRSL